MMIVIKNKGLSEDITVTKDEGLSPAFYLSDNHSLNAPIPCPDFIVSDYLAHQILRYPLDFRSHIRRVYLYIKQQNSPAIYSALVDLYLVLKGNGVALRLRALMSARSLLSNVEFDALQRELKTTAIDETMLPLATHALFTKGLGVNARPIITREAAPSQAVTYNAIEVARSYLEYSQLDEARETLEEAILNYPHQLDLHRDLLEIYQKTDDKIHFFIIYKQLCDVTSNLPQTWHTLAKTYSEETKL